MAGTARMKEKSCVALCKFMPPRGSLENESYLLGLHNIKDFALSDDSISRAFDFLPAMFSFDANDEDIIASIKSKAPALACFSVYTWNMDRTARFCRKLKAAAPGMPIIAGGPGINSDIAANLDFCDIAASGEGETPFREILRSFAAPETASHGMREKPFSLPPCERMDDIPSFWRSPAASNLSGEIFFESARGCGRGCRFCSFAHTGKRTYSTGRIIDDIRDLLSRAKIKDNTRIVFTESRIGSNPARLAEILEAIAAANTRRIPLSAYFGAENIDGEMLRLLGRAGFADIRIELMSTNAAALARICAPPPDLGMLEAAAGTPGSPLLFMDIIYGIPGDTYAGFRETLRWISMHGFTGINASHFKVLPGAPLWRTAASEGIDFEPYYPHRALSCPGFPREDIEKAARLATDYKAISQLMTPAFRRFLMDEAAFDLVDMCERIGDETPGWDKAYSILSPGEAEVRLHPPIADCIKTWFTKNISNRIARKVALEFIDASARTVSLSRNPSNDHRS